MAVQSQGLRQVQKQTQNLVLAPQLRQSLKILQVPTLELRSAILEELQTNPLLEEIGSNDESLTQMKSNPLLMNFRSKMEKSSLTTLKAPRNLKILKKVTLISNQMKLKISETWISPMNLPF